MDLTITIKPDLSTRPIEQENTVRYCNPCRSTYQCFESREKPRVHLPACVESGYGSVLRSQSGLRTFACPITLQLPLLCQKLHWLELIILQGFRPLLFQPCDLSLLSCLQYDELNVLPQRYEYLPSSDPSAIGGLDRCPVVNCHLFNLKRGVGLMGNFQ